MESMNNAEKSMIHISHLHPLKLIASPEPKPVCHACNIPCGNESFGCVKCRYYLHTVCATTEQSINHPGHTAHPLAFELTPTYSSGKFGCNACGDDGSSFCLKCKECDYDLHLHCAALPHSVNHASHHHPLSLQYENPCSPGAIGICDICTKEFYTCKWFYHCKSCDYGGHVACCYPEIIEVISTGLQAPLTPPPQSQALTELVESTEAYRSLQIQMMNSQVQASQAMLAVNCWKFKPS